MPSRLSRSTSHSPQSLPKSRRKRSQRTHKDTMPQTQVSQRCVKACERCRKMKVKCTGGQPCTRCGRRKKPCQYYVEEKRVSISESYLRELEGRSDRNSAGPSYRGMSVDFAQTAGASQSNGARRARVVDGRVPELDNELENPEPSEHPSDNENLEDTDAAGNDAVASKFQQNPLVDNDYTFASAKGKYWYMGPSSSWSFCHRVLALLALLGKRIPEPYQTPDPWHLDGMAFRLQWHPLPADQSPDVSNLPPLDYGLYLLHTVKYYFGVLFYLIDEPSFRNHMHELYRDPVAKAKSSRLWYAQYLLVLAFGNAILNKSGNTNGPPGHHFAVQAMGLMPDLSGMGVDAIESIQALALASLYLQSVDMRMAAFHHVGQALRTCIIEGMHRHVPEEVVGHELSQRCNTIFWVVYLLDREFSAQIGGPSSIRDEDITAKLPAHGKENVHAWNMSIHVELSRLVYRILTTVYGVGKEFDKGLVKNTQAILRNLARISGELTELLDIHFQGSVNRGSRMALRLVLAYHHCVVLSTRPLVMCALHAHIEHTQEGDRSSAMSLTPPVASLIQSCVDSAQTSLRNLRVLCDQDLLEAFLPFQLDDVFSSAFLLQLIRNISPSLIPDDSWKKNATKILDRMIAQGSMVAPLRKLELTQLESMMLCMTPKDNQPLTPSPSANDHPVPGQGFMNGPLDGEHGWVFDDEGGMGLSPRELLDLAEQLDVDFLMNGVDL